MNKRELIAIIVSDYLAAEKTKKYIFFHRHSEKAIEDFLYHHVSKAKVHASASDEDHLYAEG